MPIGALIRITTLGLFGIMILAAITYHQTFFGFSQITVETLTLSAYYSVQTVTTVGYGDWKPENPQFKINDEQLLKMKRDSVFFMLSGATSFALLIGIITSWMLRLVSE